MNKDNLKWLTFLALVLFLQGIYVYAFFIEPNWIQVRHVKIISNRLSKALSGIKAVQISDLEVSGIGFRELSLIEKINKLKPDIIFVTGDMVASREDIGSLWDLLSLLEPKFHSYCVMGDSDGGISDLNLAGQWDRSNAYVLGNKAMRINLKKEQDFDLWLVNPGAEALSSVIKDIPKEEPVILLNHWPDIVKEAAIAKIDLVLSGHTHGGQVGVPILRRFFPYAKRSNYIVGLYRVRDTLLYVNRGINSEKSIRFLVRPEITLFEFVPEGRMHFRVLEQDR